MSNPFCHECGTTENLVAVCGTEYICFLCDQDDEFETELAHSGPACGLCGTDEPLSLVTESWGGRYWRCDPCLDLENDPAFWDSVEEPYYRRQQALEEAQEY